MFTQNNLNKPVFVDSEMHLKLTPQITSGNDVLTVKELSKSFGENMLFNNLDFEVKRGEKVAIIGDNGTGKTTILKIINGLEQADHGSVTLGSKVHISYYDQEHHVLHSLAIAAYLRYNLQSEYDLLSAGKSNQPSARPDQNAELGAGQWTLSVLDLGTGGGFPGIPLAILFPQAHFTLCDSIGKKTKVASEVAKSLGLHNVKVVNARAETLQETFDWVVSRAVTSLENFLPWVKGKYTRGILYLKGGDLAEEISRAMQTQHFPAGFIRIWKISDWIDNPFFDTKMVLHIPAPKASLYL